MKSLRTAVVTITRDRDAHLHRQRRGLARNPPDLHVVVGMGTEPQLAHVAAAPETVTTTVAVPATGLPLAAARNAGAATAIAAGAELLVLLDVDCVPGPHLLDRYAAAAPLVERPALLCGPVAYLPPPPDGGYPDSGLADLAAPHPARPAPPDGDVWPETRFELFWSLSFAVTAADWIALGGFCEEYTGYGGEDTDFALTAATLGAGLYWVGGADAHHQHHPPSRGTPGRAAEIVRNAQVFHRRWGRWPMTTWLEELATDGLIVFDPARGVLSVIGVTTSGYPHTMSSESQAAPTVEVEQNDRGWMVVHVVDGDRVLIEPPHADQESAEFAAKTHREASDRWTGAAEHVSPEERPENQQTDGS